MNLDLFRAELAELAEDVQPVDLRDRVHVTSRRIGRRRLVVAVTAAVAAVVAAGGIALAATPANNAAPLLPPADSPSPTLVRPTPTTGSSAPTGSPAPTGSSAPTGSPAAVGGPPETTVDWGTLFYGPDGSSEEDTGHLYSWSGRGAPDRLIELPTSSLTGNATVSPDGRLVAWVDRDARLYVADVDGSGKRKLLNGIDGQCWGPYWTSDSAHLGAQRGIEEKGVYDLDEQKWLHVDPVPGCHPVYSADASTVAFADPSNGRLMTSNKFVMLPQPVPGIGPGTDRFVFDVTSVSRDGRYVAVWVFGPGDTMGDVGRVLRVNAIVDVTDGSELDLPLAGREMRQAYFRADGSLIVRTADSRLILFSADREKVAEVAEPAALRNMQIISVAG